MSLLFPPYTPLQQTHLKTLYLEWLLGLLKNNEILVLKIHPVFYLLLVISSMQYFFEIHKNIQIKIIKRQKISFLWLSFKSRLLRLLLPREPTRLAERSRRSTTKLASPSQLSVYEKVS